MTLQQVAVKDTGRKLFGSDVGPFLWTGVTQKGRHFITSCFLANVNLHSRSLYAIARPSVVCLPVCRLSVTLVCPTQSVQILGMFLRHLVPWPSVDIHGKFYGDRTSQRPKGTPPFGGLNAGRVAKYSDFWRFRRLYVGNGAR